MVPESHRYREPPQTAENGVPGYYLERPELTVGFFFRPDPHSPFNRFIGWKDNPDEDRATLFSWSTPDARLFGRTEGYASYHSSRDTAAGDTNRPSEHILAELIRDSSGNYAIRVYWGELDPLSLAHPSGTPGGNTGTAWPPGVASDGYAPPTFNIPQAAKAGTVKDPTANDAKNAQVVVLGHETSGSVGLDNPLQYDWLITISRKFVSQGSGDNRVRVVAVPITRATGVWHSSSTFRYVGGAHASTTGYGVDRFVADGTKQYPDNQSCFTADYQGVIGLNYRSSVYAMSLGGKSTASYGDEWQAVTTWRGSAAGQAVYPAQGDGPGFMLDKNSYGFPFRGWMKDLFILKRYLTISDVKAIAKSGGFSESMRLHFGRDILGSWTFSEGAGTALRDMKGNDIRYEDKIITSNVNNVSNEFEQIPSSVGHFPRSPPPRHNEVDVFATEYSPVTGLVQRLDYEGNEEIYVTAQTGLYKYSRTAHTLTRVLTLPGQGGPSRASIVVDDSDIIHIGGGPGRPVVITRDKTVALSGIFPPLYQAPDSLITGPSGVPGGISVTAQFKSDANADNLVGWEIPDGQQVTVAIGYWSDVLNTRSAPGPVITCRFTDPTTYTSTVQKHHRLVLGGLPIPDSDNAHLITHWEIYRTPVNGQRLFLEARVPINNEPGTSFAGFKLDSALVEQADFLRAPPPEGMRYLSLLGERLFGIGLPNNPRSLVWSRIAESTTFPPIYEYTLTHTASPAAGIRTRRDRAFAASRDYLYQVFDKLSDVDPDGRIADSVIITPLTEGVGAMNQDAIADDQENGLYLFGSKSVYLTEGGIYQSLSKQNDSHGSVGSSWSWPDSWNVSDPDSFVTFHLESRRLIGICGPSADDANRRDAMLFFYENMDTSTSRYERNVPVEMTRIKGLDATSFADIYDPATGRKEVWFGSANGYIYKLGKGYSLGVDYDWLSVASPKVGIVISSSSTNLRVEATWSGMPSDFLVGSTVRVYRRNVLVASATINAASISSSWTDLTLSAAPSALPGDTFTIGAIPLEWRSGALPFTEGLQAVRARSGDIRLKRT